MDNKAMKQHHLGLEDCIISIPSLKKKKKVITLFLNRLRKSGSYGPHRAQAFIPFDCYELVITLTYEGLIPGSSTVPLVIL